MTDSRQPAAAGAGNLDRQGGLLVPEGAFDALTLARVVGVGSFDNTVRIQHQNIALLQPLDSLFETGVGQ